MSYLLVFSQNRGKVERRGGVRQYALEFRRIIRSSTCSKISHKSGVCGRMWNRFSYRQAGTLLQRCRILGKF